ncbi:type II toxin-antitoxin system RelE/ParE family toxin [Nitrosomonas sp. Nm51]|uniref:type II toxin-antitoxin system RelE/ParE family toxin n=1 Tax=Nitrosomonas sp. Nm51 TaxID=133720 RepID=UPI00210CC2FB|nr:type II toxin-antitoxin system RelE/ParE family toxin [Nitrosomonas sp. Nm51]
MVLKWTTSAELDLVRLHTFLALTNPCAALQIVQRLITGTEQLLIYPQLGVLLHEFAPRNVRRIIIDGYELRYVLTETTVYIFRSGTCGKTDYKPKTVLYHRKSSNRPYRMSSHKIKRKFFGKPKRDDFVSAKLPSRPVHISRRQCFPG